MLEFQVEVCQFHPSLQELGERGLVVPPGEVEWQRLRIGLPFVSSFFLETAGGDEEKGEEKNGLDADSHNATGSG